MMKTTAVMGCLAGIALLAGCADSRVTRHEADFGTSQKLAIYNQILNPAAEENLDPVEGLDGQAAAETIDKYRDSFGSTKQPTNYTINIGK